LLSKLDADIVLIYREGTLEDIFFFLDNGYAIGIFVDTEELPYWSSPGGHAVVVVGYSDQDFYLHDPAFGSGPQTVAHGDLQLAWQVFDSILAVVQRKPR
jgi:hypothetical protein